MKSAKIQKIVNLCKLKKMMFPRRADDILVQHTG